MIQSIVSSVPEKGCEIYTKNKNKSIIYGFLLFFFHVETEP